MIVKSLIKKSEYHDSVSLMLVARELSKMPGVTDAAVVMATEANKAILKEAGLLTVEIRMASPNDLAVAVSAENGTAEQALVEAERLLGQKKPPGSSTAGGQGRPVLRPRTLRGAVGALPHANVAVVSVAGRYAAGEAWDALHQGLHVLLFSDNVSLKEEIALKQYACQEGLLLMGPGAGTAFLNGAALGFANAVPRGPVGVVSAAGTGLQEVVTLLAKQGIGITQGIGTGGRDLKEEVGGLMMLAGLKALQEDPATRVIVLVSKPPAASVVSKVLDQVAFGHKPTVVCLLGADLDWIKTVPNALPARTLQEAALLAARAAGAELPEAAEILAHEERDCSAKAAELRSRLKTGQRYLRGLFSGGTLCYEAQVIWRDLLPWAALSNAPLAEDHRLRDSSHSQGHCAIDLGEEEFTVGRPHPMIDNDLRIRRLLQEARDPEVAVVLLDLVLGYGAHPDPASELAPAITHACHLASEAGRELIILSSVTGTQQDPQGYDRQARSLEEAGATVCSSNAAAARLAARIVEYGR